MPSLAEADAVMASEAINAAPIRTMRLIKFSPVRVIATSGTSAPEIVCSVLRKRNNGAWTRRALEVCAVATGSENQQYFFREK